MPRPCCQRLIGFKPHTVYFKPAGVPLRALAEVVLGLDELEALRLADLNGQYQEAAAEQMKVSRPTFARIIEQARRKVADALVHGKALRVEGGTVTLKGEPHMPAGKGQGGGRGLGMGGGQGRMGGQWAAGPGGHCVCPQCGQREPHERGVPCNTKPCPKCGTRMSRE